MLKSVTDQESRPAEGIALSLLGGFSVDQSDAPVDLPAPAERLVASLAVTRCARLRSQLAGMLWPDKPEARALANVRAALWQINKRCEGLVVAAGGGLAIGPEVEVDLWRSLDWCDSVLADAQLTQKPPSGPLAQLDLLPAWSDEWLVFARQYHRLQWLQAIDELASRMLDAGDYAGALQCGLNAIGADYFHERGHEVVIASLIGCGNRVEAIRHYEVFKQFMATEMSMPPSERVERLVAAISPAAFAASP